MGRLILTTVLTAFMALCVSVSSSVAKEDKEEYEFVTLREMAESARMTHFVWFGHSAPSAPSTEEFKSLFNEIAEATENYKAIVVAEYEGLGGLAVGLNPQEIEDWLEKLRQSKVAPKLIGTVEDPKDVRIEQDNLVQLFDAADCNNPTAWPNSTLVPNGVKRVGGPLAPDSGKSVWIIDSGISDVFDGAELTVDRGRSAVCKMGGCDHTKPAKRDKIWHGTIIAGIIAARAQNSKGLVGVVPGQNVVSVQVFKRRTRQRLAVFYQALQYVLGRANSGDVVNISWGFSWNPMPPHPSKLEEVLHDLADKGVKVAVAAGNIESIPDNSGYVETISPARMGAYRHRDSANNIDGAVVTVSAAEIVETSPGSGDWVDTFWNGSAFGNGELDSVSGEQVGPPDFAMPGVNVEVLWLGNQNAKQINSCTGTSFATAYMSGLLIKGMPKSDGRVRGDPSARFPVESPTGQTCWPPSDALPSDCYDDARQDPIGVWAGP